jgi:hypothetical protein
MFAFFSWNLPTIVIGLLGIVTGSVICGLIVIIRHQRSNLRKMGFVIYVHKKRSFTDSITIVQLSNKVHGLRDLVDRDRKLLEELDKVRLQMFTYMDLVAAQSDVTARLFAGQRVNYQSSDPPRYIGQLNQLEIDHEVEVESSDTVTDSPLGSWDNFDLTLH